MRPYRIAILGDDPWVGLGAGVLREMGHDVRNFPVEAATPFSEIASRFESFAPDFCFGRGLKPFYAEAPHGPELEAFLEKKGIPFASWYFDNPESTGPLSLFNRWQTGPYPKSAVIFSTDRHHLPFFTSKGMKAYHLPHSISAELEHFTPDPKIVARYAAPLNFVGTPPNTNEEFDCGSPEKIRSLFRNNFLGVCSKFWAAILDQGPPADSIAKKKQIVQAVDRFFGVWHSQAPAYAESKQALLAELKRFLPPAHALWGVHFLDFIYSNYQLVASLSELREKGIRIYGGESWANFFKGYQPGFERIDFSHVASFFAAGQINFCLTKWQYHGAVHDRPLMVFASGSFALTDYREELEETFEPGEVRAYHCLEEAKEMIDYYLSHPSERLEMVKKARARIFKDHTYHQRMQKLLVCLKEAGALNA